MGGELLSCAGLFLRDRHLLGSFNTLFCNFLGRRVLWMDGILHRLLGMDEALFSYCKPPTVLQELVHPQYETESVNQFVYLHQDPQNSFKMGDSPTIMGCYTFFKGPGAIMYPSRAKTEGQGCPWGLGLCPHFYILLGGGGWIPTRFTRTWGSYTP